MLSWRASPKSWILERSKNFWEYDVLNNDDKMFKENFRMSKECFKTLCGKLGRLSRTDTKFRKCISLEKRVAIALYCVGSSAEYRTVGNLFGVGKSTVCKIVLEFCKEIWKILMPEVLNTFPLNQEKIEECVKGFERLGFPQCLGAIDGCHIEIKPRSADATDYYNYKGWYSTVLLALVDYRYRFLYINIGSPGRCNDSSIYENSLLKTELGRPILKDMAKQIKGVSVPVCIIGDSAFRSSDNLMKPYPFNIAANDLERNFNYALSKSRRVVENAFGHIKARFRRIGKGIDNHIDNTSSIIKTCCVLHNYLNNENDKINKKWLEEFNEYVESNRRHQPHNEDVILECNTGAETIRKALAKSISSSAILETSLEAEEIENLVSEV